MTPVTQTHKSQQFRLFLKISLISIIVLLLMIPKMMIESINSERQRRGQDVQHEIAQSWGHEQIIASPILSIPTQINYGNDHYGTKTLHIAPKTCNINTDIEPSIRKKSIYECVLYTAQNSIEATYTLPDIKSLDKRIETIFWDRATIDIGTSDASRIAEQVELTWDDHNIPMKAGASHSSLFSQAIHAKVPIDTTQNTFALQTKIILHGSESVKFTRLADQMNVTINSPWPDPGFVGSPLPRSRDIKDAGFTAEWATNAYSQATKSQWWHDETQPNWNMHNFGVELVQPVDFYQKNMRSAKYALMIISLSFVVFFFFEKLRGHKIHPIQYLFIGLGLVLFYLLLVSLSEMVGFGKAYLIATIATVGLITWYTNTIVDDTRSAAILTSVLGGLYTYIYFLLQLKDYALLTGSIGLFFILAGIMYLSKHVQWQAEDHTESSPQLTEKELI